MGIGIVASLLGGAVFAAVMTAIGIGVYFELDRMTARIGQGVRLHAVGYAVILLAASVALLSQDSWTFALFIAAMVLSPAVIIFRRPPDAGGYAIWVATLSMGTYVALPVYAAISLRRHTGTLDMGWADTLGAYFTLSGDSTARGMAWCMMAIAATWFADSFALFVGRTVGRTPLSPHISPNKTLEGAAGGVLGSVIATVLFTVAFGISEVSIPLAVVVGIALAVVGICGDLFESYIKRASGVKDSGTSIPGHGGLFDRVDALLPALVVAWVFVEAIY
jgi:phosphatidate cytidylyltransferase